MIVDKKQRIGRRNMKKESSITFISTREVAEKLSVSRKQVIRWMRGAGLPGYQIGRDFRFIESEIDQWIAQHKYRSEFDNKLLDGRFQPLKKKNRD